MAMLRSRWGDDERQAALRAELAGAGVDPTTLDPSLAPAQQTPTVDMFTPNWGLERPGDMGAPVAPLPTAQSGAFPMPSWGTLGGAAGMGQPMSLYERGGGQSAYGGAIGAATGAIGGLFAGGGGRAPGGYGQAPAAAAGALSGYLGGRQSPLPYSKDRPSPTPYGMGRPSPTPYQGSGYSTLGGMSGYGRQRY